MTKIIDQKTFMSKQIIHQHLIERTFVGQTINMNFNIEAMSVIEVSKLMTSWLISPVRKRYFKRLEQSKS